MNKLFISILVSCIVFINSYGQISVEETKRLMNQLLKEKNDSVKIQIAYKLATGYRFSNIDSSLFYSDVTIELAEKLNKPGMKSLMLSVKGATVLEAGRLPESLQFQFESLEISEKMKDTSNIAFALNRIGNIYMELGDYKKANEYYFRSKNLFEKIGNIGMVHNEVSNIGNIFDLMQIPDSGLYYHQIVYDAALKTDNRDDYTRPEMMFRMGNAYKLKGDKEKAMYFYKQGIEEANIDNDIRNLTMNNLFVAKLYDELSMPDSSIKYAYNAIQTGKTISFRKGVYDASTLISGLYKKRNQDDSAYKYLSFASIEKESLTGTKRFQELQRIILDEQQKERDVEAKRIADRNKQKQIALLAGLGIILIIATILFRNNKQKQKTNRILENSLTKLRLTQSQLIQSEKMASLGELTAGIAHEIQNPLNFVNNFSEVNTELIKEIQDERRKTQGERDEELENELLQDIAQNQEKVLHHGKRADAIVKGMLQHSRTSSGQKEFTDINALCDEYLRLSYHGLRAKDKAFNAKFETDFDSTLPKLNVVPQDIGRVILNLINNAFYAVNEKSKHNIAGYEPIVSVSTHHTLSSGEGRGEVLIKVKDNGNGIPDSIKEKIFQPFFTTKPTGQGTGLGLSLSYDIVKAHGGELRVETLSAEAVAQAGKEGEGLPPGQGGTRFSIQLPF